MFFEDYAVAKISIAKINNAINKQAIMIMPISFGQLEPSLIIVNLYIIFLDFNLVIIIIFGNKIGIDF